MLTALLVMLVFQKLQKKHYSQYPTAILQTPLLQTKRFLRVGPVQMSMWNRQMAAV